MITNYLDLLTYDLLEKLLDIVADMYKKDIEIINSSLTKLNKKINTLNITKNDGKDYYCNMYYHITYGNILYCMDNYLFQDYPLKNLIVIDKKNGKIFKSPVLKYPTYFTILIEISKIYDKQTKYYGYYDDHHFLEALDIIPKEDIEDMEITPKDFAKYNYIGFWCGLNYSI